MINKIEMRPVTSSNVSKIGHDEDSKTLAVEFNDGSVYHYENVPKDVYDDILASKSVGKYIHSAVKGTYKHKKLDERDDG